MKRRAFLVASSASFLASLSLHGLRANPQTLRRDAKAHTCKILALDGGGIRGVIPAYILKQIEAELGKRIYECFDIIAGTSTGGIITMGLTTPIVSNGNVPYSASEILQFYMTDESNIFVYQSSGDVLESKYYGTNTQASPPTGVEPWLQSKFTPTMTLSQAQKQLKALDKPVPKQVLATCYTLNGAAGVSPGPYLFNWVDAAANPADDYCVWEAAQATSAAPTYFPVAHIGMGVPNGSRAATRWATDGGVSANNPALYGMAWAARLGLFTSLSDVLIVSLGTGLYNAGIQITNNGNWGTVQWAAGSDTKNKPTSPLLNVLSMSNVLAPDQQLRDLMPLGSYYRLDPVIPYSESKLDGTDVQDLLNTATSYIGAGGAGYNAYRTVVAALK